MAPPGLWTLEELEREVPWIEWREPAKVTLAVGEPVVTRFACRVCIANEGLAGTDVLWLPEGEPEVRDHLREEHGA